MVVPYYTRVVLGGGDGDVGYAAAVSGDEVGDGCAVIGQAASGRAG